MLKGKKIVIAITGSIAAYKIPHLVRLLVKQQAEVKILLTPSAEQFVSPLVLSTLSRNTVITQLQSEQHWNNHVEIGLWADAMLIAPCSANTLSKMAQGICDNMVLATYLSAKCQVFFAPAMDLDMMQHTTTKRNISLLQQYGNILIPSEYGELASGLVGDGRMAEPENIISFLQSYFERKQDFLHKKILITSGPTRENIDPVRFITNNSSGKMGTAICEAFIDRGAQVIFITGKSRVQPLPNKNLEIISVDSADEMLSACALHHANADIVVFAAAVADYKVKNIATHKIKKNDNSFVLELVRTVDIALTLSKKKSSKQIHVGFALETNNEKENAIAKIKKKNFDLIVLNSLQDKGAGFETETNKITIFTKKGKEIPFETKQKNAVANDILNEIKKIK